MTDQSTAGMRGTPFAEALGERYLSYALSTIMARSLPDVRDGLKPVHRRLLYAMRQLRLDPGQGFKKCARVVGDVMGQYHPHGDQAIYDAMVRLAQDFAQRYRLVDGQGNFGNIDGDSAAAMRYTEARLTAVAVALLDGLDEDAVDFRETYDGEGAEPVVLPAAFPNLLANGAQGIAVGMATSIPPHNAGEICRALLHLLRHPDADIGALMEHLPGPDFPTGGVVVEDAATLRAAYAVGRGGFRVRARWTVEKLKNGLFQVIVTEMPYQVQKAKLIERIADLLAQRKLALLADVRDESTDVVRLVLEPKSRNVDPEVLMESLFRQTDLESRVPLNMNVLDAGGVPRVMPLGEVLQAFLDHRHVVLLRRTRHRLDVIARRLDILAGYLVAYLNLDEVIRIIREEDEAKLELIRRFDLTDTQAEAILNMRLRSLRKLEEIEIRREHDRLTAEQSDLNALLDDPARQRRAQNREIREIERRFGGDTPEGRRRTEIAAPPAAVDVPLAAMVEREAVTVVLSTKGWIRSVKGHLAADTELKFKESDGERLRMNCETTDRLLVMATTGRIYTLSVDKLPGGRGLGEPLRLMVDIAASDDVVSLHRFDEGASFLVASSDGRGFVVDAADVVAHTRAGRQVLTLADGARAAVFTPVRGDMIAVIGDNRKLLLFPAEELPRMARGRGVILQRYKGGGMADVTTFRGEDGLRWQLQGGRLRTETDLTPWLGKRGQSGRLPPMGFPRSNRFA